MPGEKELFNVRVLLLQGLGTYFGILKAAMTADELKALYIVVEQKSFIKSETKLVDSISTQTKKDKVVQNIIIDYYNAQLETEFNPTKDPNKKGKIALSPNTYKSYITTPTNPISIAQYTYKSSNDVTYIVPAFSYTNISTYMEDIVLARKTQLEDVTTDVPIAGAVPIPDDVIKKLIVKDFKITSSDYIIYTSSINVKGYEVRRNYDIQMTKTSFPTYVKDRTMYKYGLTTDQQYFDIIDAPASATEDTSITPDEMLYKLLGALQVGLTVGYSIAEIADIVTLYEQIDKGSAIVIQVKYILEDIEVNYESIKSIISSGQLATPITAIHAILNILGCITRILNNLNSLGVNTDEIKELIKPIGELYSNFRSFLDSTVMPPVYLVEGILDIAGSIFFGPLAPLEPYMLPGIDILQTAISEFTDIVNSI